MLQSSSLTSHPTPRVNIIEPSPNSTSMALAIGLGSALQLPEPAVEKPSTPSYDLMTVSGNFSPQVHLVQPDLVNSALRLCKRSSTRSQQEVLSTQPQLARMDGRESEKNLFLCENIRASKSMALHQQWNIANLQAVLQSGDVSRNTNASANTAQVHVYFIARKCWDKRPVIKLGKLELGQGKICNLLSSGYIPLPA